MSDDGSMATGSPGGSSPGNAELYGATGEPLRSATPQTQQNDQLGDFVRQQPFTAAITALVVGYLLGKIA